mmetsp:Transcript_4162/g.6491  ORF Transcript_4162/g.6491 Transcript_4162/m.6491 type:complete len:241 (-) Transcript_4162:1229-1951(-)
MSHQNRQVSQRLGVVVPHHRATGQTHFAQAVNEHVTPQSVLRVNTQFVFHVRPQVPRSVFPKPPSLRLEHKRAFWIGSSVPDQKAEVLCQRKRDRNAGMFFFAPYFVVHDHQPETFGNRNEFRNETSGCRPFGRGLLAKLLLVLLKTGVVFCFCFAFPETAGLHRRKRSFPGWALPCFSAGLFQKRQRAVRHLEVLRHLNATGHAPDPKTQVDKRLQLRKTKPAQRFSRDVTGDPGKKCS